MSGCCCLVCWEPSATAGCRSGLPRCQYVLSPLEEKLGGSAEAWRSESLASCKGCFMRRSSLFLNSLSLLCCAWQEVLTSL